ncbi:class I SAM-dependent methyltransferase [Actinocorallia libanotica]|uniref:Class I SAM-dependent methyltransferase n=1 Tax=Actinocorallia libanotica TaxID=46162 RepID=A0ABN1S1C5_9ACTN
MSQDPQHHWEDVYAHRDPAEVSWYQADPAPSLALITSAVNGDLAAPIIDVGGGASILSSRLAAAGHTDVTVLDVSRTALAASRAQDPTGTVQQVHHDLLTWKPQRRYRLWHDRAVFHFLTGPADRDAYRAVLDQALAPGGTVVLATFALDGPTHCSGLEVARYDAAGLAAELGDRYTLTAHGRHDHHTPWNTVQHFTWITATRT